MTEIKLYKKPLKGLRIIALTIPFVAIGIWMLSKKSTGSFNYIMGWITTGFFGLGIPVGLFHALDRRPQIIINENGIWDRTTNQGEIKWEQIRDAYPLEISKQEFVCLDIDDTAEIRKPLYRWAAKMNEVAGAQKVNLLLSQLKTDPHTMANFINEIVIAGKPDRSTVIKKYFGN